MISNQSCYVRCGIHNCRISLPDTFLIPFMSAVFARKGAAAPDSSHVKTSDDIIIHDPANCMLTDVLVSDCHLCACDHKGYLHQ